MTTKIHEGASVHIEGDKLTLRFAKACDCEGATASGPRIIWSKPRPDKGRYRVAAEMVAFACDRCDTPWTYTVHDLFLPDDL